MPYETGSNIRWLPTAWLGRRLCNAAVTRLPAINRTPYRPAPFSARGLFKKFSNWFKLRTRSLAWPGRKQATAAKLGIYSTYFPRSSIHFLALCSNFCKPLKKKIRRFSVQPGLRGSNDLRVGRKMATFQLIFQSREQVVVRRGQTREYGGWSRHWKPR